MVYLAAKTTKGRQGLFSGGKNCKITRLLLTFLGMMLLGQSFSQVNKYGLAVINTTEEYLASIKDDSLKLMANVSHFVPEAILDLRYKTTNNFMHEKLYSPTRNTYLRKIAAQSLQKASEIFQKQGLIIKIFDAYRPYSVTVKMWEKVQDARYAADPSKGSGHNRGIAVDITLVDAKSSKELLMGTGFDNFSDTAHTNFTDLPEKVLANRNLLITTMQSCGFVSLDTEWWHFYLPDADKYELLNLSFKQLKKLSRIN